jgi:hypothetical protein
MINLSYTGRITPAPVAGAFKTKRGGVYCAGGLHYLTGLENAAIATVKLVARPAINSIAPILARVKTIWPLTKNK